MTFYKWEYKELQEASDDYIICKVLLITYHSLKSPTSKLRDRIEKIYNRLNPDNKLGIK